MRVAPVVQLLWLVKLEITAHWSHALPKLSPIFLLCWNSSLKCGLAGKPSCSCVSCRAHISLFKCIHHSSFTYITPRNMRVEFCFKYFHVSTTQTATLSLSPKLELYWIYKDSKYFLISFWFLLLPDSLEVCCLIFKYKDIFQRAFHYWFLIMVREHPI